MSIMDVFSGRAGRQSSIWQSNQLQGVLGGAQGNISQGVGAGTAALGAGLQGGLAALGQARGDINSNYGAGQGYLDQIPGLYSGYTNTGNQATQALGNAYGLNGQRGYKDALAGFQAGPGYAWQRDQASDLAARKASSLGIAGSGNTLDAITRLGSNLADQEWQKYLGGLGGLSSQGLQAAGQVGQGYTNQAQLAGQQGNALGGLGTAEAGLYNQNATSLANLNSQAGLGSAGLSAQIGQLLAQSGGKGMMAGQEAGATGLNFGLSALGSLANLGKAGMMMK